MGLISALFGGSGTESHSEDNSTTERFDNGTSVTRDSNGSVREVSRTRYAVSDTLMLGDRYKETTDGKGNVINTQRMK